MGALPPLPVLASAELFAHQRSDDERFDLQAALFFEREPRTAESKAAIEAAIQRGTRNGSLSYRGPGIRPER